MSESTDETKKPKFELLESGEIVMNQKGRATLLAKYEEESGIVTFESFGIDQKYRNQILSAIQQNPASGELTGNVVKVMAIAGRPFDKRKPGEPLPPKKDKNLGDKTPAYVKWLFKWRPQAAYARFGVFLDSNGEPVRDHCFRVEQGLLKENEGTSTTIKGDGKDALSQVVTEMEDGYVALRATCMTFLKSEVVGASKDADDPEDEEPMAGDAGDEKPELAEASPAPSRRGRRPRSETEDDES